MNKEILCEECNASFTITSDIDEEKYQICVCPFCGSETIEVEEV